MPGMSLKALRTNANLTQEQAAKILGVSKKTLCNWEKGITFPKQPSIEKMCDLYGIQYDHINFDVVR